MFYSFVTAEGIKVQGCDPLRKFARLSRRRAEANFYGIGLVKYMQDRANGLSRHKILARMAAAQSRRAHIKVKIGAAIERLLNGLFRTKRTAVAAE